jgi:hypothetical protein
MEVFASQIVDENAICQWDENQHLVALFDWARNEIQNGRWPLQLLVSVPNGRGFVTKKCVEQYSIYGFRRGLPDILYFRPRGKYHGLAIELKSLNRRARVSPAQEEMIKKLCRIGYRAEICRGFQEAIRVINDYEDGK